MKVDDLIEELKRVKNTYGNLEVTTSSRDYVGSKYASVTAVSEVPVNERGREISEYDDQDLVAVIY